MFYDSQIKIAREQFKLAAMDFDFIFHSPFALTDTLSAFGYKKRTCKMQVLFFD